MLRAIWDFLLAILTGAASLTSGLEFENRPARNRPETGLTHARRYTTVTLMVRWGWSSAMKRERGAPATNVAGQNRGSPRYCRRRVGAASQIPAIVRHVPGRGAIDTEGEMSFKPQSQAATTIALPQRLTTAVFGGLIGLFLIYGIGFAQPETIHNAAHDTRHAASFPCH
jgi:cobalt transporter subunit CbtB